MQFTHIYNMLYVLYIYVSMKDLIPYSMPYAIGLSRYTHCEYIYNLYSIYIYIMSVFYILCRFSQKITGIRASSSIGWDRQMLKLNCLPPHGRPPRLPAPDTRSANIVGKKVWCVTWGLCTARSTHISIHLVLLFKACARYVLSTLSLAMID